MAKKTIENKLEGMQCPACKEKKGFKFRGVQEIERGKYLQMYTCQECNTTLSERSIINYNERLVG